MKNAREIKIGILAIVAIFGMIWGYNFIIGQNLLKPSRTLFSYYSDVSGLNISAPVFVNGFQIGSVTKIDMSDDNAQLMKVTMEIANRSIKIPKDAKAMLASDGIVGGKHIVLRFQSLCEDKDCAQNGDVLESGEISFLNAMLGEGELDKSISSLTTGLSEVINRLGEEGSEGSVNETIRNLETLTANLAILAKSSGEAMTNSQLNLESILKNMKDITQVIADDREKISHMLTNFDKITTDIADANLGNTIEKTNTLVDNTGTAIKELQETIKSIDVAAINLGKVLDKMDSGDGSFAKLINDDKLYNHLEFTTKNMALLLQDMRLNPRRYINLSLIGKSAKDFVPAEDDPAFEGEYEIIRIRPIEKNKVEAPKQNQ